mmetsp:Transcript_33397/g.55902  ORF Transcript_33397/g.55902 Transcript_33397/m.55902 type:complete len:219 (-) Transcript_33397:100-756(-)
MRSSKLSNTCRILLFVPICPHLVRCCLICTNITAIPKSSAVVIVSVQDTVMVSRTLNPFRRIAWQMKEGCPRIILGNIFQTVHSRIKAFFLFVSIVVVVVVIIFPHVSGIGIHSKPTTPLDHWSIIYYIFQFTNGQFIQLPFQVTVLVMCRPVLPHTTLKVFLYRFCPGFGHVEHKYWQRKPRDDIRWSSLGIEIARFIFGEEYFMSKISVAVIFILS